MHKAKKKSITQTKLIKNYATLNELQFHAKELDNVMQIQIHQGRTNLVLKKMLSCIDI